MRILAMQILLLAIIAAMVAAPAYAQFEGRSGGKGQRGQQTKKATRPPANEARPVINHAPLPKSDPWAGVREAPKSKK